MLDEKNYGNRWQNYAMNKLMGDMGVEIDNLYFWEREANRKCLKETIKRLLPINVAYYIHAISAYEIHNLYMLKRVIKFWMFTKKNMGSIIVLVNNYNELKRFDSSKYQKLIVGSDQVWNPHYVANPIYFLDFVEEEKRIAFMASFGSDEIPTNILNDYKKWIKGMHYISVREQGAVDIIKDIAQREADLFFDPTLLIKKESWLELQKKPRYPKKKLKSRYAVVFMFNCKIDELSNICTMWDMELILLNSLEDKRMYSIDPAEMLYVINNAEMIFTDSFHIMALSIKLNKQFYVFNRPGFEEMFIRLESTLNRLELQHCICNNINDMVEKPISKENYDKVNLILNKERDVFINKAYQIFRDKPDII